MCVSEQSEGLGSFAHDFEDERDVGVVVLMASTASLVEALPAELRQVAQAAGEVVRGRSVEGAEDRGPALREATMEAMSAGHELAAIADADRMGRAAVLDELRPDAIKRVQRAARRFAEARDAQRVEIAYAVGIGLSGREVASAAGVSPATVRSLLAQPAAGGDAQVVDGDAGGGNGGPSGQGDEEQPHYE